MHPWRDRLGRWLSPLARRYPFSPNSVTLAALLMSAGSAWLLAAMRRQPFYVFYAVALIVLSGFADAFDGVVARERNRSSLFGDFLDHVGDRISDSLLVVGWMWGSGVRPLLMLAALFSVTLNGYLGTQIEATFGERNYSTVGRGEFLLALFIFPLVSYILYASHLMEVRFGVLTIPEWMTLVLIAFAALGIVQRMRLAVRLGRQ